MDHYDDDIGDDDDDDVDGDALDAERQVPGVDANFHDDGDKDDDDDKTDFKNQGKRCDEHISDVVSSETP